MRPEPLPERGQRACMNAEILKDGTIWCRLMEAVCGVNKKCSDYRPNLKHWIRE